MEVRKARASRHLAPSPTGPFWETAGRHRSQDCGHAWEGLWHQPGPNHTTAVLVLS